MSWVPPDIRLALRGLIRRPGFAAVAILTIALGIGANASIFSIVNGVLIQPLPLPHPDELVRPNVTDPHTGFHISLSIPNFRDWRDHTRSFVGLGASTARTRTLTGGSQPEVIPVRLIIGDFFETLQVEPALGRWIPAAQTFEGAPAEAVVSYGFWQRRLGGRPDVLGTPITLDGQPFTIVGVMPASFRFPSATTEVFLPMGFYASQMCWEERSCSQGTWAVGRLKPGVTMAMAQTDLDRVVAGIAQQEGEEVATAKLLPLSHFFTGDIRTRLWILMGAVAFVLLIACANVASLLLARGEDRRQELAVRTALGAGRARIVRQLLTESMVLAAVGGLAGSALAYAGVKLLVPAIATDLPSSLVPRIRLNGAVLIFTVVVTLIAGLLFGVAPALRGARARLGEELKDASRGTVGRGRQRLRSTLVVAEVALSLVLLVGAGLMVRTLNNLAHVDKGFSGDHVWTATIPLPHIRYNDKPAAWGFYRDLLERVQAQPGIAAAGLSNIVPLSHSSWERGIWPEGVPTDARNVSSTLYQMVTPDYFHVLGIPLLRGRDFTAQDRDGTALVAIIDETMAQRFWPGEDPIGKRVTFEEAENSTREHPVRLYRTVVGVTRNVRHYELENPSRIQVYVPMAQSGRQWSTSMVLAVKTTGDPLAVTGRIRQQLRAVDPDVPLSELHTMDEYVADALSPTRVVSGLLALFSAAAALLAAIGLFGVLSYMVVLRHREIGIRMALGALPADVLRLVTRQGLAIVGLGVVAGLLAALAVSRILASILYGVKPIEPLIYGAVTLLLLGVALGAAALPARRAVRVDPMRALRDS